MRTIRKPEVKVVCPRCKALLGITETDVTVDDVGDIEYFTLCSECKIIIDLSRELPDWMKNSIGD